MAVTFTFVDGSTIADVTTYALVDPSNITDRVRRAEVEYDPQYSVFSKNIDGGHRYVAVGAVRSIDEQPRGQQTGTAWYDLPMAGSMWAADAADMGV